MGNTGYREGFHGEKVYKLNREQIQFARKDSLFGDLYVTDLGFFPNAVNHFVDRRKTPLEEAILICCLSGQGWYERDGTRVDVQEGQYVQIPADSTHCYGSTPGWQIYWVHFGGMKSAEIGKRIGATQAQARPIPQAPQVVELFERMIGRAENGLTVADLSYLHFSVWRLLGLFVSPVTTGQETNTATARIEACMQFMRERVSGALTLEEMAQHTGYSISHFIQLFRGHTGYSPVDFYIQLKVQYASRLLTTTDLKVMDIANRCGYENPYYFSRLFRKVTGHSPRNYRNLFRV